MLAGSLAAGLFAMGMAWLLSAFLASRLLQRDAELSRDFVQSIVDTQQVATVFESGEVPRDPAFAEFFAHVAAMPDVLRANVYSPDRRVLWSSQKELIGKRFAANDELDRALSGHLVVHMDDEDEPQSNILTVVEAEGSRVALRINELLGQQQVVVKNLEANYRKVNDVSGATIMGDGRVALILDVGSLVRRSRH